MCDDEIHQGIAQDPNISRRTFGAAAAATAVLASAPTRAETDVVEQDVTVTTRKVGDLRS